MQFPGAGNHKIEKVIFSWGFNYVRKNQIFVNDGAYKKLLNRVIGKSPNPRISTGVARVFAQIRQIAEAANSKRILVWI